MPLMRRRAFGSASTSYSTKAERFHSSHSRISCVCGHRAVPNSSSLATTQHLQPFANDVIDRSLHFLNTGYVVALHDDGEVCQLTALDLAAVVAQQSDRQHLPLASLFQRHDDVARSATGGNSDGNVLRATVGNELAKENDFGANIIGNRADIRRFQCARDCWKGTMAQARKHAVDGQTIRVRRSPAISKENELAAFQ